MPGKPVVSVWARPERAGRGPRPGLSRAEIVVVAIRIADTEGLDAVSMRRVAGELGSGTMSLYRYVQSRDELVELMFDEVQGEQQLPAEPTGDWRADLKALALQGRMVALRHRWLPDLFVARPSVGPKSLWLMNFGLSAMDSLGLDIDTVMGLVGTVNAFVRGFVQAELAETEAVRRTGLTEEEWHAAMGPYMQQVLESGRYPALARVVRDSDDHPDLDKAFQAGVDLVLDGVTLAIERHSR
ncbi:TetR/AcrR family transcriptional regulator C-terminal domain-containing protein [Fodinicola feengrottensis]|uniref:TetR/AcrR family transcriptional regulator C-terminal domain-containing protein n=1 Tax=Fodinicola feengrottensis TaxID=435914 RepID=A0ABP4TGQ3_9ACTN